MHPQVCLYTALLKLDPVCRINTFLDNVDVGEYVVHGDLEAYSCMNLFLMTNSHLQPFFGVCRPVAGKLAGLDRKLCKNLEEDVEQGCSPDELCQSPVGPLAESSRCTTSQLCMLNIGTCSETLKRLHHATWQPVYTMLCFCSRKTLIYLILTLNHIYPDYDFSLLRAHHFQKEAGVEVVEEAIDGHLLEVSKVRTTVKTL